MRIHRGDLTLAIFFMLPAIVFIVILQLYPIGRAFLYSFQERHMLDVAGKFVGFQTYIETLKDPNFWNSLKLTIFWVVSVIILQLIIGVGLALLFNNQFRLTTISRGLVILPYLVATIVATTIFKFMFNTSYGIVNEILMTLKIIRQPIPWLSSPSGAFLSVTFLTFWRYFPFMFILFYARLQTIPKELYEAAQLDGANSIQLFRKVTLPMLMPVVWIVLLLRTIWTYNKFEEVYLLTYGGPMNSTTTLPIYTYRVAFQKFQLGQASTIGILGFGFLLILVIFYIKFYMISEEKL